MNKPPDKTFLLYKGKITIDYWDSRHLYKIRETGEIPISVTAATGMVDKSGPLMHWAVGLARDYLLDLVNKNVPIDAELILRAAKLHQEKKQEAATIGTLVHAWAEDYIKGRKPDMPTDPLVLNGVIAFLKWIDDHEIKILASESIVYSRKYKVAGLQDARFTAKWSFDLKHKENHKILHCGDFKTGNGIYDEAYLQATGYRQADIEESGRKYGSTWLMRFDKKTGNPHVKEINNHAVYFKGFLGALEIKRAVKAIAAEKKEEKENGN